MFRNYLITALRAMARRKVFAIVNIIGLATGMAVFLLSQLYAGYEGGYDRFFADHPSIYLIEAVERPGSATPTTLGNFAGLHAYLDDYVPEAAASARLWTRTAVLGVGQERYHQVMRFADPAFFEIFDFTLRAGRLLKPEDGPNAVVMTEQAARRYCGGLACIGTDISLDNKLDLTVVGVIADLPGPSHIENPTFNISFDAIAPMAALSIIHERDYDTAASVGDRRLSRPDGGARASGQGHPAGLGGSRWSATPCG